MKLELALTNKNRLQGIRNFAAYYEREMLFSSIYDPFQLSKPATALRYCELIESTCKDSLEKPATTAARIAL